jgi:hypothetical protein
VTAGGGGGGGGQVGVDEIVSGYGREGAGEGRRGDKGWEAVVGLGSWNGGERNPEDLLGEKSTVGWLLVAGLL